MFVIYKINNLELFFRYKDRTMDGFIAFLPNNPGQRRA